MKLENLKEYITHLANKGLADSTIEIYTLYFTKLMKELDLGKPFNQETINNFLITYKSNINRAFIKDFLEYIGDREIRIEKRTGRIPKKEIVIIPKERVKAIIDYLYSSDKLLKYALAIDLIYACALRREEVLNVKCGDFNWLERRLNKDIPMKLTLKKAKGSKQRIVIIPLDLSERIREYIRFYNLDEDNYIFFDEDTPNIPLDKRKLWRVFRVKCKKLFGVYYKLHSLRHTKSTEWYEQGVDIVGIQNRLGHTDISTTRIYINPDKEKELKKWQEELKKT